MNEQQTNALFNCKRIVPTVSTDSCVWIEKRMWEYFLVSHNQSGSIPTKCLTMLSQQIIKSSLNCDQMSPRILWLKRAKKFNAWSQTEVPAWLDCSPMMPGCRSERLLPPRHRRAGWDGLMHQDDQRPKRPKSCATKWHASWSTESRPGPRGKGWYEMIWTRREHPKSADFLTIPDFGDEKLLPATPVRSFKKPAALPAFTTEADTSVAKSAPQHYGAGCWGALFATEVSASVVTNSDGPVDRDHIPETIHPRHFPTPTCGKSLKERSLAMAVPSSCNSSKCSRQSIMNHDKKGGAYTIIYTHTV